jgi:hypothetical protein
VSDPSQRVTVSGISVELQNEEVLIDKGYIINTSEDKIPKLVPNYENSLIKKILKED